MLRSHLHHHSRNHPHTFDLLVYRWVNRMIPKIDPLVSPVRAAKVRFMEQGTLRVCVIALLLAYFRHVGSESGYSFLPSIWES